MTFEKIDNFYDNINEDGRLNRDQAHLIEYLTTTKYLLEYYNEKDNILDIGAGTGNYSIFLARNNMKVTALELNTKNISVFHQKVNNELFQNDPIEIIQGEAQNLSQFPLDFFQGVINMGPLYHLRTDEEKKKTILESFRVLKQGGIAFFAYINSFAQIIHQIGRNPEKINWQIQENVFNFGCKHNDYRDIFFYSTPVQMENKISECGFSIEKHLSADGIGSLLPDTINQMDKLDFQKWVEYHFKFCEEPSLLGSSIHNLIICKKM